MVVYHQANRFLVAEQLRDKGAAIVLVDQPPIRPDTWRNREGLAGC
jgi:hypothetical protein